MMEAFILHYFSIMEIKIVVGSMSLSPLELAYVELSGHPINK